MFSLERRLGRLSVFARAAVRTSVFARAAVRTTLEEMHEKLDKLELRKKKKFPQKRKNKSQGDLFFPPFPPKTEKQVPRGLVAKVP